MILFKTLQSCNILDMNTQTKKTWLEAKTILKPIINQKKRILFFIIRNEIKCLGVCPIQNI